jgi:hypothetical protein
MDYMHLNETNDEVNNPIVVMHDSMSEGVWVVFARRKGDIEYVVKRIVDIIKRLVCSKIVLKSDQEPAMKQVGDKARESIWDDMEKMQEDIKSSHNTLRSESRRRTEH